jgi:translation initiation factor IF-3
LSSSDSNPKQLNFHLVISEHDYGVKMRHAEEALCDGRKVRLQLKFRGIEMSRPNEGVELVYRMNSDLSGVGEVDSPPTLVGKSIYSTLSPVPPGKRVRRFTI